MCDQICDFVGVLDLITIFELANTQTFFYCICPKVQIQIHFDCNKDLGEFQAVTFNTLQDIHVLRFQCAKNSLKVGRPTLKIKVFNI